MEDRNQLDRIFSYIDEQKNMGKTVAEEDIEEKNYKAQELWKEKVWRGYAELKKAGFKGGDSLFLIAAYFAGKPDKTITPLLRRLQMVMKEREDLISGGMLAASYYGMEELSMRIPVLEEGVEFVYRPKRYRSSYWKYNDCRWRTCRSCQGDTVVYVFRQEWI